MKLQDQDFKVILAAGGNPTGILCFPDGSLRPSYVEIAKRYMKRNSTIEQFGFLEGTSRFQMSGGEFCGNAARAVAMVISEKTGKRVGEFTMSGFPGTVHYSVSGEIVRCDFLGMQITSVPLNKGGVYGTLVDMGGIVHIVMNKEEPFLQDRYCQLHSDIVSVLQLSERGAVGVVWQEKIGSGIKIHPVVWVKAIDSFFYETACGSGTLAALVANNSNKLSVLQPSGQEILAERDEGSYSLTSQMSEVKTNGEE